MDFYSIDGSDQDTQLYHNLNSIKFENFENIPVADSKASDDNYQCSDNYSITGNSLNVITNTSLDKCKTSCNTAGTSCIGFDFNTNTNTCTERSTATSLSTSTKNNTLCIKKSDAPCLEESSNNSFNHLDKMFSEHATTRPPTGKQTAGTMMGTSNQPKSNGTTRPPSGNQTASTMMGTSNQPKSNGTTRSPGNMMSNNSSGMNSMNEMRGKNDMNSMNGMNGMNDMNDMDGMNEMQGMSNKKSNKKSNNNDNSVKSIYVDLDCFMNNMSVLENHADNMMVDLSLLTSNLKTCSYVKKTNQTSMQEKDLITQINENINIPKPSTVKLVSVPASVLLTSNAQDSDDNNQIVGMTQEPFENLDNNSNTMIIIIIVIILILFFYK